MCVAPSPAIRAPPPTGGGDWYYFLFTMEKVAASWMRGITNIIYLYCYIIF